MRGLHAAEQNRTPRHCGNLWVVACFIKGVRLTQWIKVTRKSLMNEALHGCRTARSQRGA